MHFVQRSAEPVGLKDIRTRYTQAWIDYYKKGLGNKPTDKRWREFSNELGECFAHCCGYCEIPCKGEVDHFRPKNEFPELTYEWDNWVFSCHDCNHSKMDHWPSCGLLDPCCPSSFCVGTQCCFKYDLVTGEALPYPKLSNINFRRSQETIRILGLNLTFRLKLRLYHIAQLDALLSLAQYDPSNAADELAHLSIPSAPFCSLTKYYLEVNVF